MNNIPNSHLGVNRLRSGFLTEKQMFGSGSHEDALSGSEDSLCEAAASNNVYDLTTEDDDGGVTINVNGDVVNPIFISDDDNENKERPINNSPDTDTAIANETSASTKPVDQKGKESSGSIIRVNGTGRSEKQHTQSLELKPEMMMIDSIEQKSDHGATSNSSFVIDAGNSATSQVRLKDLNPSQVDDQIRYAFWYLDRHEIDLSRLARCMNCQEDGHIDEVCSQNTCIHCGMYASHKSALCSKARRCGNCRQRGHDQSQCNGLKTTTTPCDLCTSPGHFEEQCPLKHYPLLKENAKAIKIWISCCVCTSRTHLVGDCPRTPGEKAAPWSLRSLASEQVTNLSIQSGIQKLEQEAENRSMRPLGMRIKGRANVQHANAKRRDESDSDDPDFFRYPSISHGGSGRDPHRPHTKPRGLRHETLDTIGRNDMYRPPRNGFYATDSFGRRRSRSPEPFRPRDPQGRMSPSIDGSSTDSYRPPPTRGSQKNPPHPQGPRAMPNPARGGGLSIPLPTRKHFNTSSQNATDHKKAKLPDKPSKPTQRAQHTTRKPAGTEPLTKGQKKKLK